MLVCPEERLTVPLALIEAFVASSIGFLAWGAWLFLESDAYSFDFLPPAITLASSLKNYFIFIPVLADTSE